MRVVTLYCNECGCASAKGASSWRAELVDVNEDGQDEILFFCPVCALREFAPGADPERD